jgi:hypothetical protein
MGGVARLLKPAGNQSDGTPLWRTSGGGRQLGAVGENADGADDAVGGRRRVVAAVGGGLVMAVVAVLCDDTVTFFDYSYHTQSFFFNF